MKTSTLSPEDGSSTVLIGYASRALVLLLRIRTRKIAAAGPGVFCRRAGQGTFSYYVVQ
ncbi:hypothetical protein M1555_03305 [Patescibacteria group bacterium]|nr:hypothetical protein [Patescibacteria group bacterium]